jgi:hypothetical protein
MKNESVEKKREALDVIQNKTLNEVEKSLFGITGRNTEKQDFFQRASENTQRLSVTLSDETVEKLNRLKQLMQLTSVKSAQWAVLMLSKRGVKRSCSFFLRMN